MRRSSTLFIAALMGLVQTDAAKSATATTTFNVSITIVAQCLLSNTTNMTFASTGVISANVDQTSTFQVTCTTTTPYTVGLDNGINVSGAQRRMKGGVSNTEFVNYNLYSDTGRTTAWGNVTGSWVSGTGTGAAQTLTVYGRVPVQTTPSPGANYSDTVTITVTF